MTAQLARLASTCITVARRKSFEVREPKCYRAGRIGGTTKVSVQGTGPNIRVRVQEIGHDMTLGVQGAFE